MKKTALLFVFVFVFVFIFIPILLAACNNTEQASKSVENNSNQYAGATELNACSIVLTPLTSTEQDNNITRYQQAILRNRQLLPNLEKLGWAYIEKARAEFDPGFYKLAQQTAECIEKKDSNSHAALLLQGHVLHNLHRFGEAEDIARQLISQRGLWFEYGLLGDVLIEQGQLDAAADAYQAMMDQRPGPQVYSRAAHLRWLKGDLMGAIDMMQKTVTAMGSRTSEATAWAEVRLSLYLLQAGDVDSASQIIRHALTVQPNYAPALLAQGRLSLIQNKTAEAVEILTKAAEINPLPQYQWLLIEALNANQQQERAQQIESRLKRTAVVEDPRTYALYLASTGQQLALATRLAKQDFTERQNVFSHDAMAWTAHAAQRSAEALKHIQYATREGTQDARLFFHAAIITQAAGETAQALHWFKKAKAIEQMLLPSERTLLNKHFDKHAVHKDAVNKHDVNKDVVNKHAVNKHVVNKKFVASQSQTLALVSDDEKPGKLTLGENDENYP